jgi:hypothetical protein
MNRDELEAERENTPSANQLAKALVPPKPTPKKSVIMGDALSPQDAANRKISLATMSTRQWSRNTIEQAFRAARPVAENYLRSLGKVFGRNDVRSLTRSYLASYVKTYGVVLPPGTTLGGSPLASTASDICGPLDVPMMFMPPAVKVPVDIASKGGKEMKGWFARLFSRGPKAAPEAAAPTAAPVVAPALASASPAAAAASTAGGVSEIVGAARSSSFAGYPSKHGAFMPAYHLKPLKQPANATEQKMLAHIIAQAKAGDYNAKAAILRLRQEGYAVSLGNDESGDWMYKLNPLYWIKSSEEKKLIDKEREGWSKNAEMQKAIAKRQEVLDQANKAQAAQLAVQAAQTKSADIETQLKSIETQLAGACQGHQLVAGEKQPVDTSGKAKKTEPAKPNPYAEETDDDAPDAEDAAPVLERIKKARDLNANNAADLATVSKKMATGKGLTPEETAQVMQYLARNERLHEFRKSLVTGENYAKNPSRDAIKRQVVLGAMKALTPSEQQMMAQMIAMAKQGNPNARMALAKLQQQGYSVTAGDGIGFGISDAWHVVTAPIKYGIVKPLDWTAQKLGITSKSSPSAQQVRLQRLQAAQKRIAAAEARARAADAETDAERRVQEQEAAAAQAEADAADAAATATEAKELTAEQQYLPATAQPDDGDDQSGHDNSGKAVITPLPPTPSPSDQLATARRKIVAKKNPRAAKILAASETDTPQGKKLKASMALYTSAKKGNRKDKAAIFAMARKAKKGDKQAREDMLALKAAQIAVKANQRANRTLSIAAAKNAANKKGIAMQKRLEANASQALIRRTRARKLAKVAHIERKAAAGHKPSQMVINNVVTRAKKGDPQALAAAKAFKLAQTVRTQAPTRAERKKLIAAHKLVLKTKKGNKKSLAEMRVLQAAAAHGNPNAKHAMKHVKVAAATEVALATGAIVLPTGVALSIEEKKRQSAKKKKMQKHIASVESRIAKKTASREEAQKAASEATALGDKETATRLSAQATELPSAQDNLRRVATVAAAAAAGSAVSQEKVAAAQERAAAGDSAGIAAVGQLAAVKALDDVRQNRPIDPPMKTAVQDLAKAEDGDEATKAKIAAMQTKAATGDSDAVKYMTYATGAAVVARSLANNPAAEEEWQKKAGVKPKDTENEYVETGRKPLLPAMPGPEPIKPLEPIQGFGELITESLKALLFATRDPVQNYKEAVLSRARMLPPLDVNAGEVKPPKEPDLSAIDEAIAPGIQAAIEARKPKVATMGAAKKPLPPPAPATPAAAAAAVASQAPGAGPHVVKGPGKPVEEDDDSDTDDDSGEDKPFKQYMADARKTKKISQADLDKSILALFAEIKPESDQRKDSIRRIVRENLVRDGVTISGDDAPADIVAKTKTRLSAVKEAAATGNADAVKKWKIALANYQKHKSAAAKGDAKAQKILTVLDATGLFTK